jgi:hypothetical protein
MDYDVPFSHSQLSITTSYEHNCSRAVPIIPLPGTSLPSFGSGHVTSWFHIRQKKRCYRNRFSRYIDILISTSEIKVHKGALTTPICRPEEEIFAQD